jgi:glycerol kinase
VSDFRSRFVGEGNAVQRLLALLESIVFLIQVNLEELRPHGPALGRLVLTGGIASSNVFCRRLADLSALPVWRSREAEATARGLAWLTAEPENPWPAGPGEELCPRPDAALRARFGRWRAALNAQAAAPS